MTSRSRPAESPIEGDSQRTFVIVGASLAGATAAATLRSLGCTGRIVLLGAEDERPYERPPVVKGLPAW